MSLTSNDIIDKEFSNRFRGYDPREVDVFLEEVAAVLGSTVKDNNVLKDQLVACKAQVTNLKKRDDEFREALTSAHKLADEMKSQAGKEADFVLERAKLDAERIVVDAHQEAAELEERIRGLRRVQRETTFRIRSVIEGYLRVLDEDALPPEDVDQSIRLAASEVRAIQDMPNEITEEINTEISITKPFSPEILEESAAPERGTDSRKEESGQGPALNLDKIWPSD